MTLEDALVEIERLNAENPKTGIPVSDDWQVQVSAWQSILDSYPKGDGMSGQIHARELRQARDKLLSLMKGRGKCRRCESADARLKFVPEQWRVSLLECHDKYQQVIEQLTSVDATAQPAPPSSIPDSDLEKAGLRRIKGQEPVHIGEPIIPKNQPKIDFSNIRGGLTPVEGAEKLDLGCQPENSAFGNEVNARIASEGI